MHKHSLMLAALLSSATFSAAAVALPAPAAAAQKVAPADEYFGPLAMSILGIRNAHAKIRPRDSISMPIPQIPMRTRPCAT
jgi:hypothetical protein